MRACKLESGTVVRRGTVDRPNAWVPLANPPVDYVGGSGSWLRLCYADGSRSEPMPPSYLVEVREGEA